MPQTTIRAMLSIRASGKDELIKDNAAIDVERQNHWAAMGRLEQMIHISKTMDARLEAKALELDATDPAKAKAVRETALFYVRQRSQDLLTQMAVTVQGYLRSEEHTSELQSLMRISYAVFCLKTKTKKYIITYNINT